MNKTILFVLGVNFLFLLPLHAEVVNINSASAEKMARLIKGVGPKKAKAIVLYRKRKGEFKRPWHIIRVKGIGRKTYEKNKHIIVVNDEKLKKESK